MSVGRWDLRRRVVVLDQARGNDIATLGQFDRQLKKQILWPEEALYLIDKVRCVCCSQWVSPFKGVSCALTRSLVMGVPGNFGSVL